LATTLKFLKKVLIDFKALVLPSTDLSDEVQTYTIMPVQVIYIASALLFAALLPLPYGYYTLVRLVTTCVFVWASIIEFQKKSIMIWVFAFGAILFNPLIPVHLNREIWIPLDIISAFGILLSKKRLTTN